MKVQAYVFINPENPGAKRVVGEVRKIAGVVRADALFGTPDVIGRSIKSPNSRECAIQTRR